jgi:hypothetical protein
MILHERLSRQSWLLRTAIYVTVCFDFLIALSDNEPGRNKSYENSTIPFGNVKGADLRNANALLVRAEKIHAACLTKWTSSWSNKSSSHDSGSDPRCKVDVIVSLISEGLLSLPKYARDLLLGVAYNAQGERIKSRTKIMEAERAFDKLSVSQKDAFTAFLIEEISPQSMVSMEIFISKVHTHTHTHTHIHTHTHTHTRTHTHTVYTHHMHTRTHDTCTLTHTHAHTLHTRTIEPDFGFLGTRRDGHFTPPLQAAGAPAGPHAAAPLDPNVRHGRSSQLAAAGWTIAP